MKKSAKKLTLSRETMHRLTDDLSLALGGRGLVDIRDRTGDTCLCMTPGSCAPDCDVIAAG